MRRGVDRVAFWIIRLSRSSRDSDWEDLTRHGTDFKEKCERWGNKGEVGEAPLDVSVFILAGLQLPKGLCELFLQVMHK